MFIYNYTKKQLQEGCIIASIAHVIMMNSYPELSFEQSWDGLNYSIQDGEGIRGTLSFAAAKVAE